jgi:hypothetical protein
MSLWAARPCSKDSNLRCCPSLQLRRPRQMVANQWGVASKAKGIERVSLVCFSQLRIEPFQVQAQVQEMFIVS